MTAGSGQVFPSVKPSRMHQFQTALYILLMLHKIWNVSYTPTHKDLARSHSPTVTHLMNLVKIVASYTKITPVKDLKWSILSFINSSHLHASVYDAFAWVCVMMK